ncbi:MAG TPA: LysM peptidoglycan-binding domain-containing protein [Candidatus Limnocylindrales bacterium]|nr:LysM peptidoglycan-binding domain-containing protein [Candidatus Limnocylindrales bacterium]
MSTYGATAVWVPTASGSAHELRLTRRGRLARTPALIAVLLLLAVSVADVVGTGRALAADTPTPSQVSTQSVVVESGDSLWGIAVRTAPDADPREVVTRIRELNGMRSNLIQPGQVLLVPSGF